LHILIRIPPILVQKTRFDECRFGFSPNFKVNDVDKTIVTNILKTELWIEPSIGLDGLVKSEVCIISGKIGHPVRISGNR
jgi:hypothetical protein